MRTLRLQRSSGSVVLVIVESLLVLCGSTAAQDFGGASGTPWVPGTSTGFPARAEAPGTDVQLGGTNEPTIAVNPLDAMNIATASLFEARLSIDGGATWTAPIFPPAPPGMSVCGDPTLAFDSQGRLFWVYLGCDGIGLDLLITRLDPTSGSVFPGYPVNITASIGTPASSGFSSDKAWLAADRTPGSPFQDRLYVVWTDFAGVERVFTTHSADQGMTWSPRLRISVANGTEGFVWPAHVAVAPNGDVYVAYHGQTGFNGVGDAGGNPIGTQGRVFVKRSADGGVTYPQKTSAYGPGAADITFNVQNSPDTIPGTTFWTQGSVQPWVLPDPLDASTVYVVACDDPDNVHGSGDEANVYLVRSSDQGLTWSAPTRIDHGPATSFQLFPTAAIDDATGAIAVTWYDNRNGAVNGAGNFLLDLFATVSLDGGAYFLPDFQLNDVPFDPDLGAPFRYLGPPPTTRIGEYMGVAVSSPALYAIWTGNLGGSQQVIFDRDPTACEPVVTTYCTSKTTSAGCLPFLTFSGTPSATGAPFHVFANDHVEGQVGLYLYSPQKTNLDFHGGKLCVKPPFKRLTTLIKTTDAVACTTCAGNCRTFKRDIGQLIQSGTDPMLTPGQSMRIQTRQRDPANTIGGFADNLSDGVAFAIQP